jgi:predicted DNA-binding WGR domain protein
MERYELVKGTSSKFWQFEVRGSDLVVEYGRTGTKGQATIKSFESPASAQAAAAKLVKEKTGKGYSMGSAAPEPAAPKAAKDAAKAPAAKAPAGAAPAPTPAPQAAAGDLPEWLTEAMLAELLAKLGKKSKRSPTELADQVVGTDEGGTWGRRTYRSNAAIAILIDRGLWPEKRIPEVLREAVLGWAFMRPETLLGLIKRPDFDDAMAEMALMRLGTAAPALLAPAKDAELPPNIARLTPLVRRRLGLSEEPLGEEVADRLAAAFVRGGGGSVGGQIERQGRCLADRYFSSYADYRAYIVATFGIRDWDERVAKAAEHEYGAAWRAEPVFLTAPVGELAEMLTNAGELDGAVFFRWLESRGDEAAELVKVVKAMDPGKPIWGNRHAHQLREAVAVVAGARLAEAGKAIPAELPRCLWFLDNLPPTELNHAYARALASWPKELVHARVREILKPPKEPKNVDSSDDLPLPAPVRAAVALGVHPDAPLTKQLLDGLTWPHLHDAAAYVGRLGLEHLPDLLERQARDTSKREYHVAIQTLLVNAAETSGEPFGAEHDVHFDPKKCRDKTAWERAVTLLPQARRDAYFLAWAGLDPFELHRQLHRVSDEALDQIVGLMFSMRGAERVYVTYPKGVSFDGVERSLASCGPRVLPMIEKHYRASGGDASARELLAHMPLQPEAYAALASGGPAAPVVVELDLEVASRLTDLLDQLQKAASIKVSSGSLMVATSGHAKPRPLSLTAPKGNAQVLVHYNDDVEGSTAGLDALCLRFGDGKVASWEEIPKALESDLVGLVLGDEKAFDKLEDEDRDALDEIIESKVAHGDAVGTHDKKLVAAYVGEEAVAHQLFWGLDAAGRPACLLARFTYRG